MFADKQRVQRHRGGTWKALLLLALAAIPSQARHFPSLHTWSEIALIAATALDTRSSVGQPEANGLLSHQGRFNVRSAGLKFGMVGGFIVGQHLILRHAPEAERVFTYGNFALAGGTYGVSVYNWRLQGQRTH